MHTLSKRNTLHYSGAQTQLIGRRRLKPFSLGANPREREIFETREGGEGLGTKARDKGKRRGTREGEGGERNKGKKRL